MSSEHVRAAQKGVAPEAVSKERDSGGGCDMHGADKLSGACERLHRLDQFEFTLPAEDGDAAA